VTGTSFDPNPTTSAAFDTYYSTTFFRDQITVSFARSLSSIDVGLSMQVDGSILGGVGGDIVQANFQVLSLQGAELAYAAAQYTLPGVYSQLLSDSFTLVGQQDLGDHWEATFDLRALLFDNVGHPNVAVDFGNTALLRLQLPDGVTFRSDSGAFLSAVTTPVPEPEVLALLSIGLMLLTLRTRGRFKGS